MLTKLIWQISQFSKPFPEVNSWAYRWEIWKFERRYPPSMIVKENKNAGIYTNSFSKYFTSVSDVGDNFRKLGEHFRKAGGSIYWWHQPDSPIENGDKSDKPGDSEPSDECDDRSDL